MSRTSNEGGTKKGGPKEAFKASKMDKNTWFKVFKCLCHVSNSLNDVDINIKYSSKLPLHAPGLFDKVNISFIF